MLLAARVSEAWRDVSSSPATCPLTSTFSSASSGLSCASGTLVLVELAPVETLGEIPEDVDVPTRLRALPSETADALILWGETRTRSVINGLRHGDTDH